MYIVFLVVFFIVVIFYAPLVAEQIKAAIASVGTQEAGTTSPLWLIYNNLTVDSMMYFGSIFFGIGAIGGTIFNAVNIGLASAIFSAKMSNGLMYYLIYLIPHGIFESLHLSLQVLQGWFCLNSFGTL